MNLNPLNLVKRFIPLSRDEARARTTSRGNILNSVQNRKVISQAAANSAVEACLDTNIRAILGGRLKVVGPERNGRRVERVGHPMLEFVTRDLLAYAIKTAYLAGHGVLALDVDAQGELVRLLPLSYKQVQVGVAQSQTDLGDIFNVYKVRGLYGGSATEAVGRSGVVDIILQRDIENYYKGISPLAAASLDVSVDTDIRKYLSGFMESFAMPTMIISAKPSANGERIGASNQDEYNDILNSYEGAWGTVTSIAQPVEVYTPPTPSSRLNVADMTGLPETRIAAVLGIPPGLAQLRIGLIETTSYASVQAVMLYYAETTVAPLQTMIAEILTEQLLRPHFNGGQDRVEFDNTENIFFRIDVNALSERLRADLAIGAISLEYYNEQVGHPPPPEPADSGVGPPATSDNAPEPEPVPGEDVPPNNPGEGED